MKNKETKQFKKALAERITKHAGAEGKHITAKVGQDISWILLETQEVIVSTHSPEGVYYDVDKHVDRVIDFLVKCLRFYEKWHPTNLWNRYNPKRILNIIKRILNIIKWRVIYRFKLFKDD